MTRGFDDDHIRVPAELTLGPCREHASAYLRWSPETPNQAGSVPIPDTLYKYLPSKYVSAFVDRGVIPLRNLTYYRKIEDRGRHDLLEGLHMDYPDTPVSVETIDGRIKWSGRAAFLNSVNSDRIFAFCLSTELREDLFTEFAADACVEIVNPAQFIAQVGNVINRQVRFAGAGLLHQPVRYYRPNQPFDGDVKDPKQIPFFKHRDYEHQAEYRLVAGLARGFRLTERIVQAAHDLEADLTSGQEAERRIIVGSLRNHARVHSAHIPRAA